MQNRFRLWFLQDLSLDTLSAVGSENHKNAEIYNNTDKQWKSVDDYPYAVQE